MHYFVLLKSPHGIQGASVGQLIRKVSAKLFKKLDWPLFILLSKLGGIGESKSLNTPILDTLWLWGQFGDFVELKGWVWPLFVELKEHGFDHWHYGKDGDVGVPDPVSLTADNCEKGCDQIVTKSQSHRAIVNEQV